MFGWRQDPTEVERRDTCEATEAQPCPGLVKAIERVLRSERPRILDLGPLCGNTVIELARRGARVTVEEFDLPETPPANADEPEAPPPPLRIEQPEEGFDLVLAWEHIDFVAPERLPEFAAELRRVTTAGGSVLLLSRSTGDGDRDRRARYRMVGEDRVVREPVEEQARARWVHPNRLIEQALEGFTIQGVHLQRDQTREYLIVKQDARRPETAEHRSARGKPARPASPSRSAAVRRARPVRRRS